MEKRYRNKIIIIIIIMDEDQGCPSTLPGRVQLPDNKGAISIQSPVHPEPFI